MTRHRSNPHDGKALALSSSLAEVQAEARPEIEKQLIEVERSGDWMPAEELLASAMAAAATGTDVTLNLGRIDHLDASALQILLALDTELKKNGHTLELAKTSPHLRKWFEFAGVDDHFFHDRAGEQ